VGTASSKGIFLDPSVGLRRRTWNDGPRKLYLAARSAAKSTALNLKEGPEQSILTRMRSTALLEFSRSDPDIYIQPPGFQKGIDLPQGGGCGLINNGCLPQIGKRSVP
jgi:hypothetical protein